jgi:hypothetical protein
MLGGEPAAAPAAQNINRPRSLAMGMGIVSQIQPPGAAARCFAGMFGFKPHEKLTTRGRMYRVLARLDERRQLRERLPPAGLVVGARCAPRTAE